MASQTFRIGSFVIGNLALKCPGNITTGTGLELDEGGHAIFRLE